MATGPSHYADAERLIDEAHTVQHDSGPGCGSEELLAEALVHAMLANAAATALNDPESAGFYSVDRREWEAAASLHEPKVTG